MSKIDFKKDVLTEFKKQLKLKNFGSKKISWNKNQLLIFTNDLLQGIELQYDTSRNKFTFNLYIRPLFIEVDAPYIEPGNRISTFIDRINDVDEPTRDEWHDVNEVESISSLVSSIYRVFDRVVFPYFDDNNSCSKLLENYVSNKFNALRWSMKLNEFHDMAYIAAKCSNFDLFSMYSNNYIIGEQQTLDSAPPYWPEEMFNHKQNRINAILELKELILTNKSDAIQSFFQSNIEKSIKMYKVPASLVKKVS